MKTETLLLATTLLLSFLWQNLGFAQAPVLTTYPMPKGMPETNPYGASPSNLYTVRVSQLGAAQNSFVYMVKNIGLAANNFQHHGWNISSEQTTSWTSFDFFDPGADFFNVGSAPVTVQVNMVIPSPAWKIPAVRVLPSASKIVPTTVIQVGNTYQTSFTINFATQYSVEFYDAATNPNPPTAVPENPLLVFANSVEKGVPDTTANNVLQLQPGQEIPSPGAWGTKNGTPVNTLYFSPGVYDLSQVTSNVTMPGYVNTGIYALYSNQYVYLAGGAYVKGSFITSPSSPADTQNILIRGRGILSGEIFSRDYTKSVRTFSDAVANDNPPLIYLFGYDVAEGMFNGQQNARIEGITLIQAPFYNIELQGVNNVVNNIKAISWYPSTDGIMVGSDYRINNIWQPGNGVIEDSFLKVGDDAVKLFSSGLRVNNVVVWQLNNAGVFEFGVNSPVDSVDDVQVINSNVIRTEYSWTGSSNAVFTSYLAHTQQLGQNIGYLFNEIHVENSSWQLFKLEIGPGLWQNGVTQLGSISNVQFDNIFVADAQSLPNVFQSYDLQHEVSNITFDKVIVAGKPLTSPTPTFYANRTMSLTGDIMADPLWANFSTAPAPSFQVWEMQQGPPATAPFYLSAAITPPAPFTQSLQIQSFGDFNGSGYASPLIFDSNQNALEIWTEPLNPLFASGISGYTFLYTLPKGYQFAGVGDFNGDGITDILLWNSGAQKGLILTISASQVIEAATIEPHTTSATGWNVAGIGDFDKSGHSDILLRDSSGNLEILFMGKSGLLTSTDFTPSELYFAATSSYKAANPMVPTTGHFDGSWSVVGVGALQNGYAGIIWAKSSTGDIGLSQFSNPLQPLPYGDLIARLPAASQIEAIGDYNGDGSVDLLFRDQNSGAASIWYLGWFGGDYYQPGPALQPNVNLSWQLQGGL
ncbi:MAG: hypothetical protein JO251_02400 [Verrucomicrobia bacterium]|nr:hypothetical protein [Verrucomicrobiota bacterium]